ncbi:hypothetical protein B0H13DRAFT_1865233 [Mycena leptocephala]|nr:hypothetical protein B0H13DRAFT_1865233 [Mycena leptocephala]
MVRLPTPNTAEIAWVGLLVSIGLNLSAIYVFRGQPGTWARTQKVDDSRFSYIGDDYPNQPLVSLTTEDNKKYSFSNFDAYFDWRSTDLLPMGNGFVKLGPEGRIFGIWKPSFTFEFLMRVIPQTVLCASDTTLDALNSANGTDGLGSVYVCRDWETVYDFVEQNQLVYMK